MNKIIDIKNLFFGYDRNILENANLKVNKGDFLAIVGENGAGKTTLLKLLLRQLKPIKGNINLFTDGNRNFGSIGYLKQINEDNKVSFPITPLEIVQMNLYFKMAFFKLSNKELREMAYNSLKLVRLGEKAKYNYNTMSGGEQQRVLIAKALVNNPEILILDEPTAGIDAESKINLFKILKHLNSRHHITIIVVTHEFEILCKYFNRAVKLENKKLVEIKDF